MKTKTLILPLLLVLASAQLYAGHGHKQGHHKKHHGPQSAVIKARVTGVEPIVEVVEIPQQRRECWDEVVSGSTTHHSNDGMLVGAIIGGVIGHNIGNGRHRDATRAMGTVIGATIGHQNDNNYQTPYSYTEQRCIVSTDYLEEERILGYRVSYKFQGEHYTTRMDREPGRFVRLRISHQLLD
jgi:uncharacterized protein YcfJ